MTPPILRALPISLALLLAAAGAAAQEVEPADARACRVARDPARSAAEHAVRCAEDFVRRNGYTRLPADFAVPAGESIERAGSPPGLRAARAGTLEPGAAGVCTGGEGAHAFTVVFRHADPAAPNARAVTMSPAFGEMRVQHQDFILAAVSERRHGCEPVRTRPATDRG
jgi:hypothetical protein